MKFPFVSVIIPCYNSAPYITEAIESVLNQTYKNIEIIVVNDGSTDETEAKVLAINNRAIKYFRQDNKGQSNASNKGLNISTGDFIKFFDADDIMHPNLIEMQLQQIKDLPMALSLCSWARFYNDDIETADLVPEQNWKSQGPLDWIRSSLSGLYDMMPGWSWLIPRTLILKAGGWNDKLSLNNDFEFSIRLVLHSSFVYFSPNAVTYYRSGQPKSLSAVETLESFQSAVLSARLGCFYLLQKQNTAETRLLCANKFSYWLYRIFPHYPELVKELEYEIQLLGGTNRKIDESSLMHFLHTTIGWKRAKRLKMTANKMGYSKYLINIKTKLFPPIISHR